MTDMESNTVDALVTDPPAGIGFMGKEWDRHCKANFIQLIVASMREAKRLMKPGAHGLVWAIPRTSHWTAEALESTGFEIRDCVYHVFGSGFPKSLNIGKEVDRLQGNERVSSGSRKAHDIRRNVARDRELGYTDGQPKYLVRGGKAQFFEYTYTKGTSPWEGWGTALKPAVECWWLIRKPISEKTIAENVLKWGTGGLNIDGCRVSLNGDKTQRLNKGVEWGYRKPEYYADRERELFGSSQGRFPSHLIHDGSDEVVALFPDTTTGGGVKANKGTCGLYGIASNVQTDFKVDSGSASRFFYCAKASKAERNMGCEGMDDKQICGVNGNAYMGVDSAGQRTLTTKNNHPTVKPIALMEYLIKLITPPKGVVLDPFMGSGSTGVAAKKLGFEFIGIEKEPEYFKIAEARINATQGCLL